MEGPVGPVVEQSYRPGERSLRTTRPSSLTVAEAGGKFFSGLSWSPNLTVATGWVLFFGQFFTNLISYTSNQEVVQRYLTTGDEPRAARAIWTNALVSLPSGLLFFAPGTALWVFYKQHPAALDPALDRPWK